MDKNDFSKIPTDKNLLNIEAQKELIDYTFKKSQSYMLKTFLIVFPTILIFIGIIFLFIFKYIR